MYLYDYHIHSNNSIDGHSSIEDMCRGAINAGLQEIAITDHFEPTPEKHGVDIYDGYKYWTEIIKAKIKFKGMLKIKMGVELGQPHYFPEISKNIIDSYPYDYIIGSAHKFKDGSDIYNVDFSKITSDELCQKYLLEIKKLINWGKFDCIGHIDLIKRYCTDYYKTRITLTCQMELLSNVLKSIILSGKGIEINTSGMRQSPKETMPGLDILKLYKELGGQILTIGSDAHRSCDAGKNIKDAEILALEAGFKYLTLFSGRQMEWIKISNEHNKFSFHQNQIIS